MNLQFTSPKISVQQGKCESMPDHSSCSQNIEEMTSHHCRIGLLNPAPFPGTRLHKDKHRDLGILRGLPGGCLQQTGEQQCLERCDYFEKKKKKKKKFVF